jgi:hypothetical protein
VQLQLHLSLFVRRLVVGVPLLLLLLLLLKLPKLVLRQSSPHSL